MYPTTLSIRLVCLVGNLTQWLVIALLVIFRLTDTSAQCSISQTAISADTTEFCSSPFTVSFTGTSVRDTTPVLLSTQMAPGNFQAPFSLSFTKQNNGCRYYLEMNGSAGLWLGTNRADAYAKYNGSNNSVYGPPGMANWFLSALPLTGLSAYNPQHIYQLDYLGDGIPLTFNFTDNPYSDNSGAVTFKWYSIPCYQYHWDFGDGSSSTLKDPSHTYASNGNYTVTLTVTDLLSNCADSDTLIVSTIAAPVVSLGQDREQCEGDTVILSPGVPNVSYLWQDQSTTSSFLVAQQGNYTVTISNQCGSSTDAVYISFGEVPTVLLPEDTIICVGETIILDPGTAGNYLWQDGSTGSSLSVGEEGAYHLSVSNDCGTGSDSIDIGSRYCDCSLIVPNAFSPNGDGFNDYFLSFILCELVEYEMRVYNRWGELIYTGNDPNEGWDGSNKGGEIIEDVYVWFIGYTYSLRDHSIGYKELTGVVAAINPD